MTSLVVHFCSAPLVCFVDALDTRQNQDTRSIIFADQLAGDRIVEHQQVDSTVFELVVDL